MKRTFKIGLFSVLILSLVFATFMFNIPTGTQAEEGAEIFGVASNSFGYYIYVADSKHNRVIKYDLNGNYLTDFIKHEPNGDCPGWDYEGLIAVSVCRVTDVFAVTDYKLRKVFTFNPDSVPHHPIGDPSKDELLTPWHASETEIYDDIGNYVVDKDGHKFVRYDPPSIDFDKSAIECDVYGVLRFTIPKGYENKPAPKGDGPSEFDTPEGIAVDRRGYILIADTGNNRIQKFRRNGDFVMEWDGTDDGDKYDKPVYIIPDFNEGATNRYYIIDQGNMRLVVTDEYGELMDEFQPKDEDGNILEEMVACAIDMSYNIWIADVNTEAVYKYGAYEGEEEFKLLLTIKQAMDPPPFYTHVTRIIIKKFFGYVDEATVPIKPYAQIKNSRTLLPLRWVGEQALSQNHPDHGVMYTCQIDWDATERKATFTLPQIEFGDKLTYEKKVVELWLGKSNARVNGVNTPIDKNDSKVVPEIIDERMFVPVRFIAEAFGAQVIWKDKNEIPYTKYGEVIINMPDINRVKEAYGIE